ncbi:DUF2027 domain-containing protein [Porphyromonas pogonae]|uniref:DUF2027 domain-containing protein n=1 Tax=Porphyromonas pogonae TaxID=867595 RepID=UPI002E79E5F5|nr:DUF2027 domain-containing protein [Porphyromonas pogonae]
MNSVIKKGDKVRFLNTTGGGKVSRVEGSVVWVEDEDGFEIPTPVRECVVVQDNDTFMPAYNPPVLKSHHPQEEVQPSPSSERKSIPRELKRLPYTYLPNHNKLNVYLAYLPLDHHKIGTEPYEAYLVNDSNFTLFYTYLHQQSDGKWILRASGFIEPNIKLFIEEFQASDLNDLDRVCVQIVAYNEDKPFDLKAPEAVQIRPDITKFFKRHSFHENDFFEEDAIVYPLIENDHRNEQTRIKPDELEQAMLSKKHHAPAPARKEKSASLDSNKIVEIDLHINELLDDTSGMSNADILEYQLSKFREVMDDYQGKIGQKIVYIHGKGEGVLRNALEKELKHKYRKCTFQDASFREYGYGATMVTIH